MNCKVYLALILALSIGQAVQAQQPSDKNFCGYTGYSPWLTWYQDNRAEIAQQRGSGDTTWLYAPVTVHIVGNNNGTGYFRFDLNLTHFCQVSPACTLACVCMGLASA